MGENRVVQMGEITRSLKLLAVKKKIPIIAIAQLNRGLENSSDKIPKKSDLRESGSIEQDADKILLIYINNGQVHIKVDKNREGESKTIVFEKSDSWLLKESREYRENDAQENAQTKPAHKKTKTVPKSLLVESFKDN